MIITRNLGQELQYAVFKILRKKNLTRQKCYFVSIRDKEQTCSFFIGGSFTLWTPPMHIFGGSGPPRPPPPPPPGNQRAWCEVRSTQILNVPYRTAILARECLSSERLSLALASDFFCVLGLGLEPCVLDSTSGKQVLHCSSAQNILYFSKQLSHKVVAYSVVYYRGTCVPVPQYNRYSRI